jgi:hypothetical protein
MALITTLLRLYARNQNMKNARAEYNRELQERKQAKSQREMEMQQQQFQNNWNRMNQQISQPYDPLRDATSIFGR